MKKSFAGFICFLCLCCFFQQARAVTITSVAVSPSNCQASGSATVSATGGTTPYLYAINIGGTVSPQQNSPVLNALPAGTHTVIVTDFNGATAQSVITITGNYQVPDPVLSANPETGTCGSGNSDASIIASVAPGTGRAPFTYEIISPISAGPQASGVFSGLASDTYTVRVSDACGNFQTRSIYVPFSFSPGTGVYPDYGRLVDCNVYGMNIHFGTQGPYTATVTTSNGSNSATYTVPSNAVQTFTYTGSGTVVTIQFTNACGTSTVSGATIASFPFVTVSEVPDGNCGVSYQADPSSGLLYPWTVTLSGSSGVLTSTTTSAPVVLSGYPDGSYTITAVDKCGNTATQVFTWQNPDPAPTITMGIYNQVSCLDSTTTLRAFLQGCNLTYPVTTRILNGPGTAHSTTPGYTYTYTYTYPMVSVQTSSATAMPDFMGLAPGTYTLESYDSSGPPVKQTFTVVISPNMVVALKPFTLSYRKGCANNNALILHPSGNNFTWQDVSNLTVTSLPSGTVVTSGSWSYPSSFPVTSVSFQPVASGTFAVNPRDPSSSYGTPFYNVTGSCSNGSTIVIPPYVNPRFSQIAKANCKSNRYTIQAVADPATGVPPFQYSVISGPQTYPPQSSGTFTFAQTGAYTVLVSDACGNSYNTGVSLDTTKVDIKLSGAMCVGNAIKLYAVSSPFFSYRWKRPNGTFATGDTLFINPSTAADYGTYLIDQYIDINGCKDTAHFSKLVLPTSPPPTVSSATLCSSAQATLTASGASSYTWSPTVTYNHPSGSSVTVNPAGSTVYTVTSVDASSCVYTTTTQVSVGSTPTVAISSVSNPSVCSGGSATIVPGGASSYTLQPGNLSGTSFNVNPTSSTTYTITGASAANCPSGNAVQQLITVNATPTVAISSVSSPSVCSGGSATIVPGGASSYTLQPGNLSGTSFNVNPTSSTTYTITGSSAANCPSGNAVQQLITVNATPTVAISSVSSPSVCSGGSATIVPGGASSYTLQPGNLSGTSFNVNPTSSTTYTITGSSAANCPSGNAVQQLITVNGNPVLTVSNLSPVSCFGLANGSVTLSPGGGSGSGYSINPSVTTNLSPGIYTYTVSDNNSCKGSVQVTITQPAAALSSVVSGTTSNSSCTTPNGSASISISGGTPSYTVSWDNGASGSSVSNLNTGAHTYTVTDARGCTDNTGSLTVQGISGITAVISSQGSVTCYGGANGSIRYSASGGSSYSYTLTGSSGSQVNTSGNYTGLGTGSYTLSVRETGSGCTDSDIATINGPASPLSVSGISTGSVLCHGGTGTASVSVSGGTPAYSYTWSGNAATGPSAVYPAGTYSLSVQDANHCAAGTYTFVISEPADLSASVITTSNFSCISPNGTAALSVSGGTGPVVVLWSGGNAPASYTNTGLGTGTVSYTLTDAQGCQKSGQASVGGVSSPSLSAAQSLDADCHGAASGSLSITVGGGMPGYTYSWSNTGANVSSQSGLAAGVYSVTVTDAGSCRLTHVFTIREPEALGGETVSLSPTCPGETEGSAEIRIGGGTPAYSIRWSNGQQGSVLSQVGSGNYRASVTDSRGCVLAYTVAIGEKTDCHGIYVPEIFTPNGDGKNDKFVITAIENYPGNSINIFNRWGSLVYKKDRYNNEFDGKANVSDAAGSGLLPSGTYYVVLEFGDGKTKAYTGYLELQY